MMQGLKNRTRKALGLRKKDKETDTTSSPDKEATGSSKRGSKKANGAPNGFYGEIDWDRYASPDVDEEGFSLRPGEKGDASKGKHFHSSSDSDDECDSKKKFKVKIKPLTTSSAQRVAPSVDELKASVGGLALSPSLRRSPRRSPGQMKRNLSCEEIARPRRSTPTPSPAPETPSDRMSQNAPAFFGHPTDYDYARYDVVQAVTWGEPRPRPESPLTRGFPTGAPPPLPPKNIPTTSHYGYPSDSSAALPNGRVSHSPAPVYLNVQSPASYRRCPAPPVALDDDVFTPAPPPWVTFSGERRPPPPDEPAPPPPPPESPPPATPPSSSSSSSSPSTPPRLSPGPPPDEPPPSPPPFSPLTFRSPPDSPPSIVLGPPPEEPAPPLPADFSPSNLPPLCLDDEEDEEVLELARYAPTSPAPPLPPGAGATPSPSSLLGPPCGKRLPPPLEELPDHVGAGCFRGTPPPLPPTTYRSIGSSPGPPGSGTSTPVRPATPQSGGSPVPPPPPPRPSSRPKLPPGKPISDLARPFSPPVSSSPPPFAPLARAESSSSISSITSHSAASTPTLGRDLNMSNAEGPQPLVWFDHGRFFLAFEACSRGPSPLTMGTQDTLPVAAAFTETINAYFKGADPSKCVVKIMGEMVLSFPAGITRHFSSQPTQPVLTFTISNYRRLEQVLPNPQLLCCDSIADSGETKEFWVNMPNLMSHLKRVAEQKPQATYYNVDMIKYQVSGMGIQSTPLNLAVSWRGDANSTDLRIDYKYNTEAMAAPVPLHNIQFLVHVDGGVAKLQAMMPSAAWNPEQQTMLWKINCLSHRSDNGGVGALLGRFQLTAGPSRPSQVAVQFSGEGSTLSGCDIQLVGAGYRLSLVKKRFAAGKYLADN